MDTEGLHVELVFYIAIASSATGMFSPYEAVLLTGRWWSISMHLFFLGTFILLILWKLYLVQNQLEPSASVCAELEVTALPISAFSISTAGRRL